MTDGKLPRDIVVLVADKNMEFAVKGIFSRAKALGIRELTSVFYVHPESDPGCLLRGHDFLRPFASQFVHALVVLDREGSGQDKTQRENLEEALEKRLSEAGWGDRAAAIVIDPELEIWVWSDSPHVDAVLDWTGKEPDLRHWLQDKEYLPAGQSKPKRPKEAVEQALRSARKPRSSSIYSQLAMQVSLDRCVDPSFVKLKKTLQSWFPVE